MGGVGGGQSRRPGSIDSSQNMAEKETRNDEMGSMMASSMEDQNPENVILQNKFGPPLIGEAQS